GCPDVPPASSSLTNRLAIGAPPAELGGAGGSAGSVFLAPLAATDRGPSVLDAAGLVLPTAAIPTTGAQTARDGVVVRAQGGPAAGLEVELLMRGDSGLDRGLSELRCPEPATETWFTGAATVVGVSSTLVVANPGDVPALVDIELSGSKGPIDAAKGHKLTIAPGSRLSLPLEFLAPDEVVLGVHVVASSGRVVSSLRQVRGAADAPLGVDWIPPSAAPAKVAVLPGLPAGPGDRILVVGNTGPDDSVVSVQLVTAEGQFVPTGLAAVAVGAHTTKLISLTGQLATAAASVRVTSESAPIVASVFLDASAADSAIHEFAWVGAGLPLSGPTLVGNAGGSDTTTSTLYLSAPEGSATVTVGVVPNAGRPAPTGPPVTVSVPAGRLVALPAADILKGTDSQGLVLSVTGGSGPVYAGRWLVERGARGPLVTYLQLVSAPRVVPMPTVLADQSASLPR
ncbi:MAG: DUF5719 family protein, partial [Actinomycetota bacterium]|nr:DUF5719 family protein [Actinomycetota bacterium]